MSLETDGRAQQSSKVLGTEVTSTRAQGQQRQTSSKHTQNWVTLCSSAQHLLSAWEQQPNPISNTASWGSHLISCFSAPPAITWLPSPSYRVHDRSKDVMFWKPNYTIAHLKMKSHSRLLPRIAKLVLRNLTSALVSQLKKHKQS